MKIFEKVFAVCLGSSAAVSMAFAGDGEDHSAHGHDHDHEGSIDWVTGEGVNIGGFLFPELFASGVIGESTADPADLAMSDHDPQRTATLHSFHIAGVLQVDDWLTGFANYEGAARADGTWNGVLEEAYAHLYPTDWLAIGGGQFLNSFGFQNERHVHAWDFVDQYLVSGRMLNEGELTTQGGEVILHLPTPWHSVLTIGGGGVRSHGHGGEEHGHGEEAEFEADGANFANWVVSGNYRADYGTDRLMAGTASFAVGENGFGEITQVYGLGHEIIWNGGDHGEFGTGSLRWRSEAMLRSIKAISEGGHHEEEEDEHGHHEEEEEEAGPGRRATLDEFGFYSMLQYGLCDCADLAFRAEWVSGIDEMGLDERWRLSPAITAYLNDARTLHTRLQYNYDHGRTFGGEHSIWFQVGIAWGRAPGHHGHEH